MTPENVGRCASIVIIGTVIGGLAFMVASASGSFGSRGVKSDYSFEYQGKPAIVQHEDIIMGSDRYWILMNSGDKIREGIITSDDGKVIYVGQRSTPHGEEWAVKKSEKN